LQAMLDAVVCGTLITAVCYFTGKRNHRVKNQLHVMAKLIYGGKLFDSVCAVMTLCPSLPHPLSTRPAYLTSRYHR